MTTSRADEALTEVRRLDEARTPPGEWTWSAAEWDCGTEFDENDEPIEHGDTHNENCERNGSTHLSGFTVDCGDFFGLPDENAAYIAASTHPTTGWRAAAEKAARLEAAGELLMSCRAHHLGCAIWIEYKAGRGSPLEKCSCGVREATDAWVKALGGES